MKKFAALLLLTLCFFVCHKKELFSEDEKKKEEITPVNKKEKIIALVGGTKAMATIEELDSAVIYRLADKVEKKIVSESISLSKEQAKKISSLLLKYENYGWDSAKMCEPTWGVMITFHKGKENINVLFCFSCDILQFENGNIEDFDQIRKDLLEIIKPLMPNDKIIQGLK